MLRCVRTTLTLDDDVAARLVQRRRADPGRSFKDLVNETLRAGLESAAASAAPTSPFRTTGVRVGRCLLPSLDDTGALLEWLDEVEGSDPPT